MLRDESMRNRLAKDEFYSARGKMLLITCLKIDQSRLDGIKYRTAESKIQSEKAMGNINTRYPRYATQIERNTDAGGGQYWHLSTTRRSQSHVRMCVSTRRRIIYVFKTRG